jgi:hypothetical protein
MYQGSEVIVRPVETDLANLVAGTVQRYTERFLLLLKANNNLAVTLGSTNSIANHALASN